MNEDLIKRLNARGVPGKWPRMAVPDDLCQEAATALSKAAARIKELEEGLSEIVACDDDAGGSLGVGTGLQDCIDNAGQHFRSAQLEQALIRARQLIQTGDKG